ncbi:MAG: LysR family transcriptional regulator [Caulobacterales bacterium]
MDWDDLKLLLQVSRNPKLAEVSSRVGQDATTVSRRLRKLEQDLGLALFERTRRGHVLTPDGQEVARRAEQIEQSALEIAAFAEAGENLTSGRVRLGVTEGLGTTLIAPAIGRFAQKHPRIELDLIALSGFVSVSKREADMSVLLTRPQTGRLKVRKLTDYALRLYSTKAYLEEAGPVGSLEDLRNRTLIGYVDDFIYSPQLRYYDELLPGLAPRLCSSSIIAQVQMTASGAGIAILPSFLARREPALVPILHESVRVDRSFWLVIHEDVSTLARINAVADFLLELMNGRQKDLL